MLTAKTLRRIVAGFTPLALILCILSFGTIRSAPPPTPPKAGCNDYNAGLHRIDSIRKSAGAAFVDVRRGALRDSLLENARRTFVESVVEDIVPCWYGTPWNFNGTTETPGSGTIACGYFVSTVLRDAGLKVERVRMAQQASELIVKSLCSRQKIERFSNVPLEEFVERVRESGSGLYVVGLDYHVGFLHVEGSDVWFIHSSYVGPKCVMKEPAGSSVILNASKYRVIGHISANDALIRSWLNGTRVPTARR